MLEHEYDVVVTALSVDDKAVVHYLHSVNSGDGTTARVPIALLTHHSYEPGLLPGPTSPRRLRPRRRLHRRSVRDECHEV